jgi:hypothetical protein
MGRRQAYLIAESLIDTQVVFSYAWKDIASMPRGVLPPQASVMALSPLLDVRSVSALGELQARGFDVAVIRMNAAARFAPGGSFDTAVRLWRLARELPRTQLTRQGIAVAEWDGESPLDSALQELRSFRKRTWHASA